MSEEVSLCKQGMMSTCSAENIKGQKKCKFYEKASYENRCMYFMFNEYCDCLEAQEFIKEMEVKTRKLQKENQKKIDEEIAIENERQETIVPT